MRRTPFHGIPSMNAQLRRWIVDGPRICSAALWIGHGYPLFAAKLKAGKCSSCSRMMRSLVTFATMEAAAMESEVASPFIKVRVCPLPTKSQLPSTRTRSALTPSPLRALRAARRCASDMPSRSHSWWVACPIAHRSTHSTIRSNIASRSSSVSIFESRTL